MRSSPPPPRQKSALAAFLDEEEKGRGEKTKTRVVDLKKLMRLILASQSYQRSSQASKGNEPDERFYSRYYPKRLKAEVLLDIMSQVSGSPNLFKDFPAGTRAMQLPDANIASEFLKTFGRPERILTCECERSDEPSMTQVLHILNGETLIQKLESKDNRLRKPLEANVAPEQLAEKLFLAAFSRFPTERERQKMSDIMSIASPDERRQAVEDL